MTKSELYYLAGKCLVMDEKPEFKQAFIKLCEKSSIDWIQFVSICSDNLILPTIYLKFRSCGITEYLPEEVIEHLSEIYELNKKRNTEILRQIKYVTSVLNKNNIFPLYLKGAGNLLDDLYSDVGERIMGDIDLLVHENDFIPSVILMLDNGFLCVENNTEINIRESKHYPRIYHPDFICDVEIHRMPVEKMNIDWFNSNIVYSEKKKVKTMNGCFVQSNKHKIIHNFIHDHLEHQEFGNINKKIPLRDIYDLYLLSKGYPLNSVISEIKYQEKAIGYFAFVKYVYRLDDNFFAKKNFAFRILKMKNDLNLDSVIFRWVYPRFHYRKVRNRYYLSLFIKTFYSGETRQKIFNKISSKQYYIEKYNRVKKSMHEKNSNE
jgi:hypothetical protein